MIQGKISNFNLFEILIIICFSSSVHHVNLQKKVLERPTAPQRPPTPPRPESPPDVGPYSKTENKRLKDLLLQRDNEISILLKPHITLSCFGFTVFKVTLWNLETHPVLVRFCMCICFPAFTQIGDKHYCHSEVIVRIQANEDSLT